jgi:hypothetical protein
MVLCDETSRLSIHSPCAAGAVLEVVKFNDRPEVFYQVSELSK